MPWDVVECSPQEALEWSCRVLLKVVRGLQGGYTRFCEATGGMMIVQEGVVVVLLSLILILFLLFFWFFKFLDDKHLEKHFIYIYKKKRLIDKSNSKLLFIKKNYKLHATQKRWGDSLQVGKEGSWAMIKRACV